MKQCPSRSILRPLSILTLGLVALTGSGVFAAPDPAPAAPLVVTSAPSPLTAPERVELLARLQAFYAKNPSFRANFSEQRATKLLKKPLVSMGNVAFQMPDKFRREVAGSNPSLTVCNGRELWLYYPHFLEAENYPLGKKAIFDEVLSALTDGLSFNRVEDRYQVEATPEPGGGYRILLTPKRSNLKRIMARLQVTLDRDLNVAATDLTLPKGDQIVTTYTQPSRAPLPAATFEFTPPAGANVTHPLGK